VSGSIPDQGPDGLWVEADDQMHIELGPRRPRTLTLPTTVGLVTVVLVASGLVAGGLLLPAVVSLVAGQVGVAGTRLWQYAREDASLRVSCDERQLVLTRHCRHRVLWSQRLPLSTLHGCEQAGHALVLHRHHGAPVCLEAPFRSVEQLTWTRDLLARAIARHQTFRDDDASAAGGDARRILDLLVERSGS